MTARRAVLVLGAACTVLAATVAVLAALLTSAPSGPRPCSSPSLPSGDAARVRGHEAVCTDGRWVPVTGYGILPHGDGGQDA